MAMCDVCGLEMTKSASCSLKTLAVDGKKRPRIPFGNEAGALKATPKRCRDCGVSPGGFHHAGCAVEQCAVCGEQLFCCDCDKEEPRVKAAPKRAAKPPARTPSKSKTKTIAKKKR